MWRSNYYVGRINSFQNIKRVASLPVSALLGLACGILQPFEHIVLSLVFDVSAAGERIAIEAVTEVCGQTVPVG